MDDMPETFDALLLVQALAAELRADPRLAQGGTPALVDAAHSASEALWLPWAAEDLQRALTARGFAVEIHVSTLRTDPWDLTVATPPQ